jgi:transposase
MIRDFSGLQIYIRPGFTDMRKAANGLSVVVSEAMNMSPLDGSLFLFCNRERKIIKVLYWDRNGFCLWQKKLEKHRFPWPVSEEAVRTISTHQLFMLLDGIDFWNAHGELLNQAIM